ncbi:MAG: tetratricopeptide repeat protein [Nodosilinea sp.]
MAEDHWLTQAERALAIGSGLGTVASIAAQNAALATAPLTVMMAVGLLNRHRVEQQLTEAQEKLARQHRQTGHRLANLSKQVSALPAPEALTNFQRAMIDRNNRSFMRLAKEINGLRHDVDQQGQAIPLPDLGQLHQDIAQLQDQYACANTSIQTLTGYVQRLSTVSRLEAAETKLSQVKTDLMQTRVTVETVRSETRTLVTGLQDTIAQLDRRLAERPQPTGSKHVKAELTELTRLVANLVPQTEFAALVSHVKDLTRQQADLERTMAKVPVEFGEGPWPGAALADPNGLAELDRLNRLVHQLQQQLNTQESEGHSREQVQQMVSQYLSQLKAQLAQLEKTTQTLAERQQRLTHQWGKAQPRGNDESITRKALVYVAQRLQRTKDAGAALPAVASTSVAHARPPAPAVDWMMDFPNPNQGQPTASTLASRQALELALATASRRLLLVWPWASQVHLDEGLLQGFTQLLERGGQLEIGWCHQGDQRQGRLASRLSQRWGSESTQLAGLKAALSQLLPLRESYADRFKFKIMGTAESYLVCDSGPEGSPEDTYAIISLKSWPTQSVAFPAVETKLRTANPQVVQGLMQRFADPTIAAGDMVAFFNRGNTRHDLRDQPGAISDYGHVLALQPDHAVALNNRGVAHLDLNCPDEAEADFTEAIALDPQQFAAYCNRGWLRLEQRRYPAAIKDLTQAIGLRPQSPMAYVYRGSALQKLGDLKRAIRDYSAAIACNGATALPYCYRSAAYESQGDSQRAIADLEVARTHLETQGDVQAVASVQRTLSRLQSLAAVREKVV